MRVLVWGINYAPEVTGIAPCNVALCEFLRGAGHEAEMLTSFAYYPDWKKAPGDAGRLYRDELIAGVPVHRCWHYVPARASAFKRILHEGTFVCTSFLRALALARPDVIVTVSPPLLLGAAGWLLGHLRKAPFVFHVQDLQPDAAVGLGMLKNTAFTRQLYRLESFAYERAARVCGISRGMLRAFVAKGVPASKCVYFPNGLRLPNPSQQTAKGAWRARHGFGAEDFLAVYSGNLGIKQGLEVLAETARLLPDNKRVRIVVCGQGAARARLEEAIAREHLPNLTLLPLQDADAYEEMMADTDVCLITQQAGTGQYFFPSKLLTALAFARPVLAVADPGSELAVALDDGHFGWCARPGDAPGVAQALAQAASLPPEALRALGEAGRSFGAQFDRDQVHARFVAELELVARAG